MTGTQRGLAAAATVVVAGCLALLVAAHVVSEHASQRARSPLAADLFATTTGPLTSELQAHDVASYYTVDGTAPALHPYCTGVFTFCLKAPRSVVSSAFGLGTPVDRIDEMSSEAQIASMNLERWTVDDIVITIGYGEENCILMVLVEIDPRSHPHLRVALPGSLVLGESTMAEVRERWSHLDAARQPPGLSIQLAVGSGRDERHTVTFRSAEVTSTASADLSGARISTFLASTDAPCHSRS